MAAKKTVAEKNTVSAIALFDLNIIWEKKVYAAKAFNHIELPHNLYEHLLGFRKISAVETPTVETVVIEEPTVEEPVVEAETPTEEVE